MIKKILKNIINRLGYDVAKYSQSSAKTMLGLTASEFDLVVDVGANRGQFARVARDKLPNVELICFEPLGEPFEELSSWALTQGSMVRCFQAALSDEVGEVHMNVHIDHFPSSSLLEATAVTHELFPKTKKTSTRSVRLDTLDSFFNSNNLMSKSNVLLKLDVQGSEDRVLRGGRKTLGQCLAVVLEVCIDQLYHDQADFIVLANLLFESGLSYRGNLNQVSGSDGKVTFLDAVFTR